MVLSRIFGKKILSEKERLERIVNKLPTRGTNMYFTMFNDNQRAVIFNLFGEMWYEGGKRILENKGETRAGYIKDCSCCKNQEKGLLICHLGIVEDDFYSALRSFWHVNPELRVPQLKSEILPYISKFADRYNQQDLLARVKELDGTTPHILKEPQLKSSKYYENLPQRKREAIIKADRIAKKTYDNPFSKELDNLLAMETIDNSAVKRVSNKIHEQNKINSEKVERDFYEMAELYDYAGEKELAAFCGQWVLTSKKEDLFKIDKSVLYF